MEQFAIFTICTISGIFTGILGIGGGLIIVPAFMLILPMFGIDNISVHQIIGISATCVFFNSVAGLLYRRKEKFLEKDFLFKATFFIILGTILSAYFSSFAPVKLIFIIYALVCLISIYLIKKDVFFNIKGKYSKMFLYIIFALIGAISAAIGIGGAILFATALKCFVKKTPKELLPTITFFVAFHAMFAFLGKAFAGSIVIYIIPIAIIASLLGAKIGVKISQKLSAQTIENLMVLTLLAGLTKIIYELIF